MNLLVNFLQSDIGIVFLIIFFTRSGSLLGPITIRPITKMIRISRKPI